MHVLGRHHADHAEIDLGKLVKTDRFRPTARPAAERRCRRKRFRQAPRASAGSCAGGHHRLDPLRIDPLHHVRELAHRRAQQRLLRLLPTRDRIAEQFAGLLGQPRQHRRKINGQLAEEIQSDGTRVLHPAAAFGSESRVLASSHGLLASMNCWPGRRRP